MKLLNREKLEENIDKLALYDLKNNNIFGSSYYVCQNGREILKKHFGNTSIYGTEKVNDETMYRLASMTKPITAVAVLILIDRGLISLYDPVSKFLPEFQDIHIILNDKTDMGKTETPVTIFHCLTHTSGFGSIKNINLTKEEKRTIAGTINCFINAGLDFEPFKKEAYSPIAAFDVLAAIVEKVTETDYGEFLKKEIFIPCNMTDTTFSPSENQWKRIIMMHNKVEDKNDIGITYPGCVFEEFPCEHKLAGAGLVATLIDYANFAKMLLNKGKINDRIIISEETFKMLSTPYVPENIMPGYESWGLGVRVITNERYKYLSVGSFGWSGAYGSHFFIDPENDICAVYMRNSRYDGGSGSFCSHRFEEALYDALMCDSE